MKHHTFFRDDIDTGILQQVLERRRVLRVAVEKQKLLLGQEAVEGIGEIPADLHHPCFIRAWRNPDDLNLARSQFNHEEHLERDESPGCPHLDREEIGRGKNIPVGTEKLAPRGSLAAFRSRVDAIRLQDVGDPRGCRPR